MGLQACWKPVIQKRRANLAFSEAWCLLGVMADQKKVVSCLRALFLFYPKITQITTTSLYW